MRKMKTALLLVALFAFSSEIFAGNSDENKSKVVYGSEDEGSIVKQSDIDSLVNQWYKKETITLVWVLYDFLNTNETWVNIDDFKALVKKQTNKWLEIKDFEEIWVDDEVIADIIKNTNLVSSLWIDTERKTGWEEYEKLKKEYQASEKEYQEVEKRKEQLENILLGS